MGTGESLTASERVQRLQTALHAKAKEAPGFRFYSLSDKVWCDDVLAVAWQAVRRNGGAAGVDGETVADIETLGVDRWLGALARGPAGGELPAACGSAGPHPEEATREVPAVGHSVSPGTGWRRRRRCWCCRRFSKPTCNRSNTPTGRAETRMTRSSACIGC